MSTPCTGQAETPQADHPWPLLFGPAGVKIIFRVALVLLRHTLGSVEKLRSCQGMYETMEQLRNLPQQCMQEDFLVHEVGPGLSVPHTRFSRSPPHFTLVPMSSPSR